MKFSNGFSATSRLLRARAKGNLVSLPTPLWPLLKYWPNPKVPPSTETPTPTGPQSLEKAKEYIANVLAPSTVGLKSILVPVDKKATCPIMDVDHCHLGQQPLLHQTFPPFAHPVILVRYL